MLRTPGLLSALLLGAVAISSHAVQDQRPEDSCKKNTFGGITLTDTWERHVPWRSVTVKHTFQVDTNAQGEMQVTMLYTSRDIFSGPAKTVWSDHIKGKQDNLSQDYSTARALARNCANTLGMKK